MSDRNFKVMIACCAWGNCSRCLAEGNKDLRVWSIISDRLTEEAAYQSAKAWSNFDGRVEPMDEQDRERAAATDAFFARTRPAP